MDKYQDTQFTIRLSRDIGQALNRLAERTGQSRNSLVNMAVALMLERKEYREEGK